MKKFVLLSVFFFSTLSNAANRDSITLDELPINTKITMSKENFVFHQGEKTSIVAEMYTIPGEYIGPAAYRYPIRTSRECKLIRPGTLISAMPPPLLMLNRSVEFSITKAGRKNSTSRLDLIKNDDGETYTLICQDVYEQRHPEGEWNGWKMRIRDLEFLFREFGLKVMI